MGWVLWHINYCGLFDAKSSLYINIKYIFFGFDGFYGISTIVDYLMPNLLYTYILNIYDLVLIANLKLNPFFNIWCAYDKFPDFLFVWALLLTVHTWNSSPFWSNLLRLQATFYTVPTKVTGSKIWTIGSLRKCLDAHLGQIVCDKDAVVDWCIVLLEMPLTRFEEWWPLPT